MKSQTDQEIRLFVDISEDELNKAVIEMVTKLGIHGSGAGYSLYQAVREEHQKAKDHVKMMNEMGKE